MSNQGSIRQVKFGSYLIMAAGFIVSISQGFLPDDAAGSLKQVGTAFGGLLVALGGYLVAHGH